MSCYFCGSVFFFSRGNQEEFGWSKLDLAGIAWSHAFTLILHDNANTSWNWITGFSSAYYHFGEV